MHAMLWLRRQCWEGAATEDLHRFKGNLAFCTSGVTQLVQRCQQRDESRSTMISGAR
jgi:hypothetical protein